MIGFKVTSLSNKCKRGLRECMKANLQKKIISHDPFTVEFRFDRRMRERVKESDVRTFFSHFFKTFIGEEGKDYQLEMITE